MSGWLVQLQINFYGPRSRVSTTANTQGVVTVTKVTASVIEGTYTLTDAPVSTATGAGTPAAVSLTNGTFRVICPR